MKIRSITHWRIWSASLQGCTINSISLKTHGHFLHSHEAVPMNGTSPKLVGYGTKETLRIPKIGQNGRGKSGHAFTVAKNLIASFVGTVINKSIAILTAKPCIIASVKHLNETEDVWCLSTEVGDFALENGAIVKNCDALRYMAEAVQQGHVKVSMTLTENMKDLNFEYGLEGKRRTFEQDTDGA